VTLSFDRTSVPMAEEPTPGAEKSPPKRGKRYVRVKPHQGRSTGAWLTLAR